MGVTLPLSASGFAGDNAADGKVAPAVEGGAIDVAVIDTILRDGVKLGDYPDELAARYDAARAENFFSEYIFLFVLGFVASFASIAIDILVDPAIASEGAFLRMVVTVPLIAFGLFAGSRRWSAGIAFALGAAPVGLMGVLAHMSLHMPPADGVRYLLGVATVLAIANITLPFTVRGQAVFNASAIAVTVGIVAFAGSQELTQKLQDLVVIVIIAFATMPIAARIERLRRQNFLLNLRANLVGEQLIEANNSLRQLSETDALTGVSNRRCFEARYQSEIAGGSGAADGDMTVGLMMIDLDHFKPFNDMHGHQAGDMCLQMVAHALREVFESRGAIFARYGGEEFIAAAKTEDSAQIVELAEHARMRVEATLASVPSGGRALITASIGVAIAPSAAGFPREELIEMADAALYSGKNAGRNRVEVVEAEPFGSPGPAIARAG